MEDNLMDGDANPYQSPATESVPRNKPVSREDELTRPISWLVFIKWLFICCVSAAPSFVLGLSLGNQTAPQVLGMMAGILLFVTAYTIVECLPKVQRILRRRFVRGVAIFGYFVRVLVSIIFPIGMMLDMWFGIFSVMLTESLFGTDVITPGPRYGEVAVDAHSFLFTFAAYTFTTIVQGILLNIVLFGFMLSIYAACWSIATIREPGPVKESDFDRQNS